MDVGPNVGSFHVKTLPKEAKGSDVTSPSRHKTKELVIFNGRKEKEVK